MYKIVVEILEGWGGYFSSQKMEIPEWRWGEALTWNSLRGGGMDIFWNYTFCSVLCFHQTIDVTLSMNPVL